MNHEVGTTANKRHSPGVPYVPHRGCCPDVLVQPLSQPVIEPLVMGQRGHRTLFDEAAAFEGPGCLGGLSLCVFCWEHEVDPRDVGKSAFLGEQVIFRDKRARELAAHDLAHRFWWRRLPRTLFEPDPQPYRGRYRSPQIASAREHPPHPVRRGVRHRVRASSGERGAPRPPRARLCLVVLGLGRRAYGCS
jgi:hypothetical protein